VSIEKLLWSHDATGLGELVRKGDVEPRELVDAAIARAEKVEPEINAIAEPLFERARALALKVDRDAPFAGVPFALKDLGTVWNGVPIHNGSRVAPLVPDHDSILVRRYLDAGLVPIATTTTPEQGIRLMTESAAFGATRNPHIGRLVRRRFRDRGGRGRAGRQCLRWRRFHPRARRLHRAGRHEALA
jgi:amidase